MNAIYGGAALAALLVVGGSLYGRWRWRLNRRRLERLADVAVWHEVLESGGGPTQEAVTSRRPTAAAGPQLSGLGEP